MEETELESAIRNMRQAKRIVEKQKAIIAQLGEDDRDIARSNWLLSVYENTYAQLRDRVASLK